MTLNTLIEKGKFTITSTFLVTAIAAVIQDTAEATVNIQAQNNSAEPINIFTDTRTIPLAPKGNTEGAYSSSGGGSDIDGTIGYDSGYGPIKFLDVSQCQGKTAVVTFPDNGEMPTITCRKG